jgi:hypothetical protein
VHQLFTDLKKAYDSVRRETLYNILTEFGIPNKLVRLIKKCLTETYSRVRVGNNLSKMFPIMNGLKHGDDLSPLSHIQVLLPGSFLLESSTCRIQVIIGVLTRLSHKAHASHPTRNSAHIN